MKKLLKFPGNIIMLSVLMILCTGCRNENETDLQAEPDSSIPESTMQAEQGTVSDTETETETGIEIETQTDLNAVFPEPDMNAVNFNDGNYSFITVMGDTASCAAGELSVEIINTNSVLKFTDLSTDSENLAETVQKIQISVGQLLSPDQLESVRKIGFDFCAVSENGEILQESDQISGGTVCADGEQYDFEIVQTDNNLLQSSGVCHVEFAFLLAESGKCWDSSVQDVNFSVERQGMQRISDFYLDNIVFYDEEGNSIPLHSSSGEKQVS